MTDKNQSPENGILYVSTHEPEAKPPPALETGVLKWVRENLFSSVSNSILTIVGAIVVIYTLIATTQWVVSVGNWLAITANIRQYMVGSYSPQHMWRLHVITLFSIFVIGMGINVWVKQIARTMAITVGAIIAFIILMPIITNATVSLPEFYMLAGDGTIQTGSVSETPIDRIGFIGQEGETVTVRFADELASSEEELASLAGYVSVPANTLRNAAANRLEAMQEKEALEAQLAEHEASEIPILTASQFDAYTASVDAIEVPEPILETFGVNSIAVSVAILDPETLEPIGEPVLLESADDVATFTLPADGWYVLEKVDANAVAPEVGSDTEETTEEAPAANPQDIRNVSGVASNQESAVEEEAGESSGTVAILDVQGIYPLLQSSIFSSEEGRFITGFKRATDFFTIQQPAPQDAAGDDLPFVVITSNQYRGSRTFGDYMRAYVSPFLSQVNFNVTVFLLFGVLGYFAATFIANASDTQRVSQLATYGIASIPLLMWIFINGFYITTAVALAAVLALALACVSVFRIGQRNGWAGWKPSGEAVDGNMIVVIVIAMSYFACIMVMERITGGGFAGWILRLGFIPLIFAGMLGTSLYTPDAKDELSNRATLLPLQLGALIIAIIAFSGVGLTDPRTEWLFSTSNPDNWSGLLLTMVLTVYGIVLAFPLGVGLALGRRSDLPLVKYLCIAYIELIRGSPFITVLFFMKLLIPLIRPEFASVPNGYRAIVATIAFSAAYLAENVRGGLQSLPPGQNEAAKALGLSAWQATVLITLPQALRAVIPALVGQFISLFKDTSLVSIIGLIDLTGFVNSMSVQPEFVGTRLEGLVFISILYFVFSYVLSYVSRLLEASGSGATRRMT